ncbi:MAG: CTP synthase [Deltaproteobacteria bacterium]|nr:CTP synthase [Deltaproteobacteria bacterium]
MSITNRNNRKTKFIFVTGGVVSSLGKGIAAASIGGLLESRGLKVTLLKMDPYINVDPGTMNPFQHGEVYVTDDGAETDLDLGHYERYVSTPLSRKNSFTSGQVYDAVISRERRGDYLGGTVQVIPHITDEIKQRILAAAAGFDVAICEVGGTVGDIEGLPFLEAIRQLRWDCGRENVIYIHLTLVPYIAAAGELKTKPTQHSVKELTSLGIQPDILLCRTDRYLDPKVKAKIAHFCNVDENAVITAKDVECIYEVPLVFHQEGLDERVVEKLNMWTGGPNLSKWERIMHLYKNPRERVRIAMIGKYVNLVDSYKSLNEALTHGGLANECRVEIEHVDSEQLENGVLPDAVRQADGLLVPMGFGQRGTEGKIAAVRYAREEGVPFLGICFGMQMAVIEFGRHVCGLGNANSTEVDEHSPHPVIAMMDQQRMIVQKGGTMRLGAYPCIVQEDTLAASLYGKKEISERHRHRYEFNNAYREQYMAKGMTFSGLSPDGHLVEIIELRHHPWFVGVQFHPELKSRPFDCHPLFKGFVRAVLRHRLGEYEAPPLLRASGAEHS